MTPALSRFIDCSRWIAALMVALHHAHGVFVNQADIMTAPHNPFVYLWWFMTAYPFAHGAVVVFFVLSGFLVGGSVIERASGGKAYLRSYAIDRTSRIYVVLIPTLALTLALDTLGRHVFAGLSVYENSLFEPGAFELSRLVTTLASLQGIWFPMFGSNVALWSLGMEYWYYIVFALLMLPRSNAYPQVARMAGFVLGAVLLVALSIPPGYFLFGGFIWLLGALVRVAPRPVLRSKWLALALWLAAVTTMRLVTRGAVVEDHPRKELIDAVNAILFANILLTLRFEDGDGFSWCRRRFHATLSEFSYTLYATHMPVLVFLWGISAWLFGRTWRSELATPAHYAWTIGVIVFAMCASYAMSRVTEHRTGAVRTWLRRVLPGGASSRTVKQS